METYDYLIDLIIHQMRRKEIKYTTMADLVGVYRTTMREYYYKNRTMPAVILFKCLQVLGLKIEVKDNDI